MEQSLHCRVKELFPGSITENNKAYKAVTTRDQSAHFAAPAVVQTASDRLLRDNCAHLQTDCFESLSPMKLAA